ncbi:hypothetical protein L195_g064478, partial [Trifolium pratense]
MNSDSSGNNKETVPETQHSQEPILKPVLMEDIVKIQQAWARRDGQDTSEKET